LYPSYEWFDSGGYFLKCYFNFLQGACRIAVSIIRVGGESKTDGSVVAFFGVFIELAQAGHFADDQREHTGGHGIEGTEVSDGTFAEDSAHASHDIVRGPTAWFVDDHHTVEWHASGIVYGEAVRGQIEGAFPLPRMMESCLVES
jgi:hypothetical protein